jgi:hypothetical protein
VGCRPHLRADRPQGLNLNPRREEIAVGIADAVELAKQRDSLFVG